MKASSSFAYFAARKLPKTKINASMIKNENEKWLKGKGKGNSPERDASNILGIVLWPNIV